MARGRRPERFGLFAEPLTVFREPPDRRFRALAGAELIPSGPRFEVRHVVIKIIHLEAPAKETFAGVQGLFSSHGAGVLP
jgi:hypothetical protein